MEWGMLKFIDEDVKYKHENWI